MGLGFGQWNGGYTIVGDGTIDLSIHVCQFPPETLAQAASHILQSKPPPYFRTIDKVS